MTNGRLPNRTRKKSNLMAYLSQVKLGVEQHHLSITSGPRDRHKNYPAFRICGAREKVTQIQIFRRPTASFHEYDLFELPYHLCTYYRRIYKNKHGLLEHPHAHRRRDRRRPLLHPRQRSLRLASNNHRTCAKIQPRTKRDRRSSRGFRERQWSATLLRCERTRRYVEIWR